MQTPTVQNPQAYTPISQPSYNAVKIDINNPQVNAPNTPSYAQNEPLTAPIYNGIPTASIYEVPKMSIYEQPQAVQAMPSIPAPVIVTPTVMTTPTVETKKAEAPIAPTEPVAAPAKTIEVKTPEAAKPAVDVNEFIAKLTIVS